ncbi:MAG: segregation/condensation protein A [Candidatus Omnitrophica bacterium]|nr:segregation/condensation protein A [Candidatus Omnitrophota bacterium]
MEEATREDQSHPGSGLPEGESRGPADAASDDESRGAAQVAPKDDLVLEMAAPGLQLNAEKKTPWHVKLAVYDGPLDLLLDLIKKNEMDVYNIQVSEITRQYLDYLAELRRLDLEVAGEFLVMAATLIYIKSRMLLPQDSPDEDEEGGDPRAELVRRLLEYQAFKEAAKELGFLETERTKVFTRQIAEYYLTDLDPEDTQIDAFSANLFDLLSAFQKVLTRKGKEGMHEVYEQVISIEERMAEMKSALIDKKRIVFMSLFEGAVTRNYLIATFLALLEIVRSKFAIVIQEKQFGEILIERKEEIPATQP